MTAIIETSTWTHPTTGQVRRYINNTAEVIGLDIDFYNSGNVRRAELAGEYISNRKASDILAARVWIDSENGVHVDRYNGEHVQTIIDAVRAAL